MTVEEVREAVPPFLHIHCGVVEKMLATFLQFEVRRVGFERVVIGLSGGIDSAVSLFLAERALGAENVLAILMPYRTSHRSSVEDARAAAVQLGVEHETMDISVQIDAYFDNSQVPREDDEDTWKLRRGNKMARERMTILYDYSVARRALVIGTSNKSELLLGYGTLFGDMASAVNPIGDLYKTQVRQLAAHLKVPDAILRKAPTADLWVGQTDEDQLGYTYNEIDQVLYFLVDERLPHQEVRAMGYDSALIDDVWHRLQSSHFKRRLPVIAKISGRTIDRDFRYARDWGY